MTKQEKNIFNHLPDEESRKEFIRDFWEKRDPDPMTEENEFKEEFFRRIEYANNRFNEGMPGWKTDRGRIYIYFGPPDKIDEAPMLSLSNLKGALLWVYYRYGFAVFFVDRRGDGAYILEPTPAELGGGIYGDFFEAMDRAKLGFLPRLDEMASKFMDFDLDYDRKTGDMVITVSTKDLVFKEEEEMLKLELDFVFFIYPKENPEKQVFRESRTFEATEKELLETKKLTFRFHVDLDPGKYSVDALIHLKPDLGKVRKIFDITA